MSNWYAAHLVMYVKLREEGQTRFTVWENVILISAAGEGEAFEKAERRGRDDAEDDESFRWGGKPARWVFAGVRKLTACDEPGRRPGDGTEITYTEMVLDSEQAILRLVNGESASVKIADRFAAPEGVVA